MKIAGRFGWISAGRLLAALLQATSLILVARHVGSSDFGVLAAFMGVLIILQTVFDFGIFTYLTRLRATEPESLLISQVIRTHSYIFVALSFVLCVVASVMSFLGGLPWWVLIALACSGAIDREADVRLTLAMADGDVWKNTTVLVTRRIIVLMLFLSLIPYLADKVLAFGLASLFSAILGLWMSRRLVVIKRIDGRLEWETLKSIFSASRPFWVHSMGVQARNFDVLIVTVVTSPMIAGYYGIIARSLNPLMMFSSSLAQVLFPVLARSNGKNLKPFLIPVGLILTAVFGAYGVGAVFADEIVSLVFGREFMPSVPGFRWALLGLVFFSLSAIQASILQARGLERMVGRISILVSVVALAGIGYGAYELGVVGAAMALACSYVLQCGLFAYLVFDRFMYARKSA